MALFLFIGVPIWDVLETRALKSSTHPRRKIFTYRRIIAVEWIASLVAGVALRTQLFYIWPMAQQTVLKKIGGAFVVGLVSASIVVTIVQVFLTRRNAKMREKIVKAFKRLDFILPVTNEERAWFVAVSVTAGICEEILYRGFLTRYLADVPWHANHWTAILISSLVFGIAHTYQGVSGVVGTTVIGAMMAVIFMIAGNLWLPMALHMAFDLRILFLLQPGESLSTTQHPA
jgi:membrane protease YdiL (CAAX protease family)